MFFCLLLACGSTYFTRCEDMKNLINQNQCPLTRQVYNFPRTTITIPDINIPSFFTSVSDCYSLENLHTNWLQIKSQVYVKFMLI